MKNKLEKLEAIRGLAAIYVVFHHSFFSEDFRIFSINLSFLFKFGQEAVILFFLMSGFVIGYSFENSKDKGFWSYFQKRFYRIYIPLIIVFVTHYIIKCFENGGLTGINVGHLLGNLVMLQDIGTLKPNVICEPFLGNSPLWSLSYEWWFYMSFYAFYILFPKTSNKNLYIACMVTISAITYIWFPNFLNRLLMYYGIWWFGVEMARSYLRYSSVKIQELKMPFLYLGLSIIILCLNVFLHKDKITTVGVSPLLELRHFAFTFIVILIALAWQRFNWIFFDLIIGPFAIFAPISYVLYISHNFLVVNATYLGFVENRYISFFGYLGIALAYSYLVEVIIFPKVRGAFYVKNKLK